MRAVRMCFLQMLLFIKKDRMLSAACFAPLLAGAAFRFLVPVLDRKMAGWFSGTLILRPYYGLIDVLFSMLASIMFCYAAAMVILEEVDDHIAGYLFVTVLGKEGYLLARLGIPAAAAFVFTVILLPFFRLHGSGISSIVCLAAGGALQGLILALLIAALSANKLEGMAVTKLSSLTVMGAAVPYFFHGNVQYVFSWLPSFWMGRLAYHGELLYILPMMATSALWIWFLVKWFVNKI